MRGSDFCCRHELISDVGTERLREKRKEGRKNNIQTDNLYQRPVCNFSVDVGIWAAYLGVSGSHRC
jgi:hypothetical protein